MTPNMFAEIMQQRMTLIEKLALLNSKQLSNTQLRSGIEVELQACINDIDRDGETEKARAYLVELEDRLQTAVNACADCDRDWQTLNDELEALDRQLQALQAGPAS